MKLFIRDIPTPVIFEAFVPIEFVESMSVNGDNGEVMVSLWPSIPFEKAKEIVYDIRDANGSVKFEFDEWDGQYE